MLASAFLLGLALVSPVVARTLQGTPGMPAITERTKASGGALSPERAALRMKVAELDLEIFPETRRIKGVATLTLANSTALDRLLIDLDRNFTVSAISIDGKPLAKGAWTNPEGALAITLPARAAEGGTIVARITYEGEPHVAVRAPWDDGFVWSEVNGQPWLATTGQGYGCDLFWPCLDFPQGEIGKMTMRITVPKGLSAPANGKLLGVDRLSDGRTRWNWESGSINPYLVALSVGPYTEIKSAYKSRFGNTFPMHYWHVTGRDQQAAGLFAEFAPTIDFFEALIGPYPFPNEKLGVVETPYLGMEHQTINAYGNNYRKDETGFDWLFHHELAHEWFGNQMTAADWDDFWLHEGYGQYMQPLYGLWREGEARYATMMDAQRQNILNRAPIVSGRARTSNDVYELDLGGPGQDIYYKGAWVLHTLRNTIGDDAFFQVTRRIVYGRPDPKPGNFEPRFATTDEFVTLVREVTGRDYSWFFDVYLRQAALPELVETREGNRLTLTWKAPDGIPFPLPVEVQVGGKVRLLPMTGGTATLDIPAGAHIVVDPMARLLKRSAAIEAMQAQRVGG
ncbi:M1 family metallopeptidase [Sphingomonas sp. AX6]|uniref:M1 family metallopeptidase n=1 Tax=Sphingomonas sp. AX6 TaxID=2653171 RepID=UPI00135A1BD8